jgi:Fur family transcriptional regulator, ferric uptake regulator
MDRSTRQRDAIRGAFTPKGRPLTPKEIQDHADREAPGVSLATIYRTVKALEEQGEIVRVELPGEPARYELAGKDHHHHFRCDGCGRAFEIYGCPGGLSKLAPPGFTVSRHEITLFGSCDRCSKAG